jgi:hypothetical protein
MIESFTGPSRLTPTQERFCRAHVHATDTGAWRRSGGAFGLDTIVAEETPVERLHLFLPQGKWWNRDLFDGHQRATFVPGGYRKRNEALVEGSDRLYAFLKSPTFYRSGEWMTVNIAKRMGVEIIMVGLPA